jgi:hypothetical protein
MRQYILRKSVGLLPGLYMWTYIGLHYDLHVHRYGQVNSYIYAFWFQSTKNMSKERMLHPLYNQLTSGLKIVWKYKTWTLDLWCT